MDQDSLDLDVDDKYLEHLAIIEDKINVKYNKLIEALKIQQEKSLSIVSSLRKEYKNEVNQRENAKIESFEMLKDFENRENSLGELCDAIKSQIKDTQEELKNVPKTFIRFQDRTSELENILPRCGEIVIEPYLEKNKPILICEGKASESVKITTPLGLAVDPCNNDIYVCDWNAKKVFVFSIDGEFIDKFGDPYLNRPYAITIKADNLYVTDQANHAVYCFNTSTRKLVCKAGKRGRGNGELENPHGLTNGSDSVFVADSNNNRIAVFKTWKLNFLHNIDVEKHEVMNPKDVKIQNEELVILTNYSPFIHFFNLSGDKLRTFKEVHNYINNPKFFCFDSIQSVLISDFNENCIRVLNNNGELITTLKNNEQTNKSANGMLGIAVTNDFKVVVASKNKNCFLQVF